jgi:hypothetical protein
MQSSIIYLSTFPSIIALTLLLSLGAATIQSTHHTINQYTINEHTYCTYMQQIISAIDTLQSTAYIIYGHFVQLYMYNQCFL